MGQNPNQRSGRSIKDVMTANPECVSERDSILDAARIMKNQDTGIVPVVEGRKIIGLITDRDIVVRGVAEGRNIENLRVNELMSKQVRTVREDAGVEEVMNLMSNAEVRRMPVVNGNDEIVGIVSLGDIASEGRAHGKVGRTVEEISEAPPNN